jgi:hypothetical protein
MPGLDLIITETFLTSNRWTTNSGLCFISNPIAIVTFIPEKLRMGNTKIFV